MSRKDVPIQPVEHPILCSPYLEPNDHWNFNRETGEAQHGGTRRDAGYFFKDHRVGAAQGELFADEYWDGLPLVNRLRSDVRDWRQAQYRGASEVTKRLLRHWANPERYRRLFFCQLEAVETLIYLAELRIPGRSGRTGFKKFELSDADLAKLLAGEKPGFDLASSAQKYYPTLLDRPVEDSLLPLRRLGCKMATGSGKTVVMAMLISWAFCNRARNPASVDFPNAVLVCCPNLTVKERLQVLRPDDPGNYYVQFDIVPTDLRPLLQSGKVLISNWHGFGEQSEHYENGKSFTVVNKGPETPEAFIRRILKEDLADRLPIMVLNDEGHHCWRPRPETDAEREERLSREEREELAKEVAEATVWVDGLDKINNSLPKRQPGISLCVDLSATPFYIKGSGYVEGSPFPWLVSDFGLVDAIESGIVKIPRLPVSDTTGRPEAKYFRLWAHINAEIPASRRLPGKAKRPKPDAVYEKSEGALQQLAAQWRERFELIQNARDGQQIIPPVMIIVCDNTDIAELFYQNISGEREEEVLVEDDEEDEESTPAKGRKKPKVVYGPGKVQPELLANRPGEPKRTIRIDNRVLADAERADPTKRRAQAAEDLRRIVATVGKIGQPGEHVRCVVSVAMLTEGWDANNVTHILGVRAFQSQLLCEQVVGRGLRRINYTPDKVTGLLPEEYVDVYGIPFSVIPFRGRPVKKSAPEDKPLNHVRALPERKHLAIRFPMVGGYVFGLQKNAIRCDVQKVEKIKLDPGLEPTNTFVRPTVGYLQGPATAANTPVAFVQQDRAGFYQANHPQTIKFMLTQQIVADLVEGKGKAGEKSRKNVTLMARHQLFPQVLRIVDRYVETRIDLRGQDLREIGLEKYFRQIVERLRDRIEPDTAAGEPPLLPIPDRYNPIATTGDVDFTTTRACRATNRSHLNQIVLDTETWEASAAFWLEGCPFIYSYARNDQLGLVIPYPFEGVDHQYTPDYLVRFKSDAHWTDEAKQLTLILEIKGHETEQDRAKHSAARKWVSAVNNWGELGRWEFHVCRDPQLLPKELGAFAPKTTQDSKSLLSSVEVKKRKSQ